MPLASKSINLGRMAIIDRRSLPANSERLGRSGRRTETCVDSHRSARGRQGFADAIFIDPDTGLPDRNHHDQRQPCPDAGGLRTMDFLRQCRRAGNQRGCDPTLRLQREQQYHAGSPLEEGGGVFYWLRDLVHSLATLWRREFSGGDVGYFDGIEQSGERVGDKLSSGSGVPDALTFSGGSGRSGSCGIRQIGDGGRR